MELEEKALIRSLQKSSTREFAFTQLVRKYQEALYWHIRKMVVVHEDADDVLQNTLIKAWNGLDNFRGDSKVSTWLFKIATNETLSFLAQKKMKAAINGEEYETELIAQLKADSYFDGNEAEKKLQEAILQLSEKQRLVFNMKYFDEMKYEEMEEILGTSIGALKASYHHATKKIAAYLTESV